MAGHTRALGNPTGYPGNAPESSLFQLGRVIKVVPAKQEATEF